MYACLACSHTLVMGCAAVEPLRLLNCALLWNPGTVRCALLYYGTMAHMALIASLDPISGSHHALDLSAGVSMA